MSHRPCPTTLRVQEEKVLFELRVIAKRLGKGWRGKGGLLHTEALRRGQQGTNEPSLLQGWKGSRCLTCVFNGSYTPVL